MSFLKSTGVPFRRVTDPAEFGRVAVLYGGTAAERPVSLRSGAAVLDALVSRGVDAHGIDPAEVPVVELLEAGFERVFIVLHGPGGEDGEQAAAAEALGMAMGADAAGGAHEALVDAAMLAWGADEAVEQQFGTMTGNFKKAGYASGKYDGNEELLMVGDDSPTSRRVGEIMLDTLQKLGFKVNYRPVSQEIMYTKFCGSPAAKVAVCATVGWLKDFNDAQTLLDPTFNGNNIVDVNNSNWPQLDVAAINDAMAKASVTTLPPACSSAALVWASRCVPLSTCSARVRGWSSPS